MITFYKADETDFDNNGLGVLDHDIQNPDIEEKLNDIFTFSFNYPIFAVNGARLAARMIVKADDPENSGQLFRILKLSKSNGMLTAFCYHIFYDLNGNEIPDTNIVGQNGQTAITQMLSKTAVAHKFQGFSDIAETANIRVVRMSPVKFLIDPQTDNNFINRLGGEIRRVNYRIWMNKVRGSDNGATIRWKKSLDSYNATWDYTTIVTRIRPVGYNGIMLPESYVDSPLIDKYETIVIKEIQYSDIKAIDPNATSNDETAVPLEQAYELLRQAAAKEFSENNLDKPTVTLSVNMVALRNMDEYKDVESLETINPWDTVTVINERDGLSVKVRLNHYHWNPVTHKFISMELGNSKSTFTDIGSKVDHATNIANQANDTAKHASASADGKNTIYRDVKHEDIVNPVNGDTCFEKNGDKEEIWIYNGKSVPPSWELIVDDATGEEVRQNVDAAQKKAEEAKNQANKAVDGANDAVAQAGFANDTATQAKADASAAGQQAKDALTNADTALTDAKKALTDSGSAMADSAQARKDSATAKIQATNAATQANQAVTDASTAKADANTAKINATQAINDAAAAKGQATNALGQANTAINNAANALDKFNNLQIGGRNLALGTSKPFTMTGNDTANNTGYMYTLSRTIAKGTTVTVTFDITSTNATGGYDSQFTGGSWQGYGTVPFTVGTKHRSYTIMTASDYSVGFQIRLDNSTSTITVSNFIISESSTEVPWTPAPEDVQQQFTDINGELANKVSQTTYNTLAGTVDTVSTLAKQNQSTISTLATKNSVDTVNHTATAAQTLAQQNATELLNKANSTTVNTLTQRVTTAESTLSQTATKAELALTKTDVDKLGDSVASQALDIAATADGLKLKADSSTISDLAGTVAQNSAQLGLTATKADLALTQNDVNDLDDTVNKQATQLALTATKAELQVAQTNVDNLKKTVTSNTAGMTANANAIKLKADSSTVSDIDGRVTSLSGQLDVQADKIAATVTANDVTGMLNGYATQTWTQNQIKMTADGINGTISSVKSTVDSQTTSINDLKADSSSFKAQFTTVNNTLGKQTTDIGTLQASSKELTTGFNTLATDNTTNKNDISQLKQTATELNSTMMTVQTQVQNSAVGTNLIIQSDLKSGYINTDNGGVSNYSGGDFNSDNYIATNGGTVFTFSSPDYVFKGSYNDTLTMYDSDKNYLGYQRITSATQTLSKSNAAYIRFSINFVDEGGTSDHLSDWLDNHRYKLEKGAVATDYSVNPEDTATVTAFSKLSQTVNGIQTTVSGKADQSQVTQLANQMTSVVGDVSANSSQITQMKADINLRVKAGDVVNQINISPESILIDGQKVHITGQTSIDNAVIKDAMIADIKADKITAGTLNAANVNVINLNANNITTGTIKGANLAINLNTGEVTFQKGRIHSASNNIDINIDQGYVSVANNKTRVLLKDGGIQFIQPNLFDPQTNPYMSIENSGSAQGIFNGASIIGRDFLALANSANNSDMFNFPLGIETFAGISFGNAGTWRPTKIGGADRGILLSGGAKMSTNTGDIFGSSPNILIGSDSGGSAFGNRIAINGEFVHIISAYKQTASGGPNVIVAADGALVRSTSASKYKTDIIRTNIPDYGEKLLELPTATWMDIAETKRYRDDPVNQIKPTRNFGMIAEDLAEAGLEMLVVRGTDGELEGINYDRIGPALIPVIAKLKNEVETLKQQLEEKTA